MRAFTGAERPGTPISTAIPADIVELVANATEDAASPGVAGAFDIA
ncbi:MAG: hypothetical protein WD230_02730 [Cucumibacter sp.]